MSVLPGRIPKHLERLLKEAPRVPLPRPRDESGSWTDLGKLAGSAGVLVLFLHHSWGLQENSVPPPQIPLGLSLRRGVQAPRAGGFGG